MTMPYSVSAPLVGMPNYPSNHMEHSHDSHMDHTFTASIESMSLSDTGSMPTTPIPNSGFAHDPYSQMSVYSSFPVASSCPCPDCMHAMSGAPSTPQLPYSMTPPPQNQPMDFQLPPTQHYPSASAPPTTVPVQQLRQSDTDSMTMEINEDGNTDTPTEMSVDALRKMVGKLNCLARTPKGSSTIQASIMSADREKYELIFTELKPHFVSLLTDSNGAYVMKTLMDTMPNDIIRSQVLQPLAEMPDVIYNLCTASLHSRRVIQYFVDRFAPSDFHAFIQVCISQCVDLSTSQHGCISIQRILDKASDEQKAAVFNQVMPFTAALSVHPFGNYVIQYMIEHGGRDFADQVVAKYMLGNITNYSCNKFASNVVEKCLYFATPLLQHHIIEELYQNKSGVELEAMLQDSFGNYIVQATIALASFQDAWMISERLKPILQHTPYGHKIEARLQRRLRGKKVALRGNA